jgi:hypothetical protein
MPHIGNFAEAMLVSVTAGLMAVLAILPALVAAVIILIAGWFLADLAARLVHTLLRRLGFEAMATRTGISDFIAMTGMRDATASSVIAELVKWFIRLIFIEIAAEALHLTAVTSLINQIVLFIPNLIVALVIVMVGFVVANFIARLIRSSAAEMGVQSPNLFATVARFAVIVMAVIIALNQIGVATAIVDALFVAIVLAVALALGLSFGLGGREVAGQIWQNWYSTGRRASKQLERRAAESASSEARRAEPPAPTAYEAGRPPSYTGSPPPPTGTRERQRRVG